MRLRALTVCVLMLLSTIHAVSQSTVDSLHRLRIRQFYDSALIGKRTFRDLSVLCKQIGGRLSGSVQASAAVAYTMQRMLDDGFDSVWLQPVMVPRWERGSICNVTLVSRNVGDIRLSACALGGL